MRIEDSQGTRLTSLDDWKRLHKDGNWKEGRSAHAIADFVVNHGGAAKLQQRVSSVLGGPMEFYKGIPECKVQFDQFSGPRVHDLGIWGTVSAKSLFVGVEAKVDEPFDKYIGDALQESHKTIESGGKSNKPQRIRELCARFNDGPGITEDSCIRYQLIYGAAGTVDAGADVSVFCVAVFLTDDYDASTGETNHQDYLRFIERAGGEPIKCGGTGASAHRLTLGGKSLVTIYERFDMR